MDDQTRLTFLTRHYYDLQGLRLAPLWLAGLCLTLIPFPAERQEIIALLIGLLAVLILWLWLAARYYKTHFGCIQPDPLRFFRRQSRGWPFWLLWAACAGLLLYCWTVNSDAWIPYVPAFLMVVEQFLNPENPPVRRAYYSAGAVLVAGATLLNSLLGADGRLFFAVMNATMLALAISDHLLLLSLLPSANQEADA